MARQKITITLDQDIADSLRIVSKDAIVVFLAWYNHSCCMPTTLNLEQG